MPASESEVLVGRRYLERGFLDAAMKLFVRNAELVPASDWSRLAERLLGRNRIADVVRVCEHFERHGVRTSPGRQTSDLWTAWQFADLVPEELRGLV